MFVGSGSDNALRKVDTTKPNYDLDIIADYDSGVRYIRNFFTHLDYLMPEGGDKMVGKGLDIHGKPAVVEMEIAWVGSTGKELFDIAEQEGLLTYDCGGNAHATLPVLYALKMSHRYLKNNPHFAKTRADIFAMRHAGTTDIIEPLQEWFKKREAETYNYGHPKLNVSKEDFFKDMGQLKYVYDHDSIHINVAKPLPPVYTKYADGPVKSSKEKFERLTTLTRARGVAEEACVLAIERSLVPHPGVKTPDEAFYMALEKVCTSITSGWFREFAWEYYDTVVYAYNKFYRHYWVRFQHAAKNGDIKLFQPAVQKSN